MKIKGTVTRVVPKDSHPQGTERENLVFLRADDPEDLRKVDGSQRAGLDEVRVVVGSPDELKSYTVGESAEFEI